MRFIAALTFVASPLLPSTARAQDPASPPLPLPPPAPAPTPAAVPPPPLCAVDRNIGLTADEARAVEQFLCAELGARLPRGASSRIGLARLGTKVVVTVAGPDGKETNAVLRSLDELPVAAPRLAMSIAERKPLEQTQDVTNVLGEEGRAAMAKKVRFEGGLGIVGFGSTAFDGTAGGGLHVNLFVGDARWKFGADIRGGGSKDDVRVFAISSGARWFATPRDIAPFLGVGASLLIMEIHDAKGDGFGAYAEAGVDVLRTHRAGGTLSLRLDLPTFANERVTVTRSEQYPYESSTARTKEYAPLLSMAFTVRF